MTADKNPLEDAVEQALDAFVFAPIGLLFDGPARFPKLVRNGKSQVTNARMMGQFAVQMGRSEVTRRTADLDGPVVDLLRGLGIAPAAPITPEPTAAEQAAATPVPTKRPAPATTPGGSDGNGAPAKAGSASTKKAAKRATAKKAAKRAGATKATAKKTRARKSAASPTTTAPSAADLPIPDFDSLSASQVVSRLRGLSDAQLDDVRAYEAATRNRKTILNKVQQLKS